MQDEIYKKYNSEHNKIDTKNNLEDNELIFLTQKKGNEYKNAAELTTVSL